MRPNFSTLDAARSKNGDAPAKGQDSSGWVFAASVIRSKI
jgi:hypothetical protein